MSVDTYRLQHFFVVKLLLDICLPLELTSILLRLIHPPIPFLRKNYKHQEILLQTHGSEFRSLLTTPRGEIFISQVTDLISYPTQTTTKLQVSLRSITYLNGMALFDGGKKVLVACSTGVGLSSFMMETGENLGSLERVEGLKKAPIYWGVAISAFDGRVAATDVSNARIEIFDSQFKHLFGFPSGQTPVGIAFQSNGNIVVADHHAPARIHRPTGEIIKQFGHQGHQTLGFPQFLLVDGRDYIAVTDWNGRRIVVFDPDGEYLNDFKLAKHPRGLALLPNGDMVISGFDEGDYCVRLFVGSD